MDGSSSVSTSTRPRRLGRRMNQVPPLAPRRAPLNLRAFHWVSMNDQWWLEAYGFNDLDYLLALAGDEQRAAGGRVTVRLPHPMAVGDHNALLLKREPRVALRDRLASVGRARAAYSAARREFEISRRLLSAGIQCPRPLVCVERGTFLAKACLLLEEVAGAVPLNLYLTQRRLEQAGMGRDAFFSQLGRCVAQLHQAGFNQPDLHVLNVLVRRDGVNWEFALRNFDRSRFNGYVKLRQRASDLAMLLATLSDRLASGHDRQCLLDAYVAESRLEARASELLQAHRRAVEHLLARRRTWEIRESDTVEHQAGRRTASAEQASLWIDPEFRPKLERAGLTSFDGIMNSSGGKCLRALKDRENWRIEIEHGPAGGGAYLKKHHIRNLASRLQARLGKGPGETAGRVEARNIAALNRAGIAAMRLIAFGERLSPDGQLDSFVLTEELAGYTQLDQFIKQRFSPVCRQRSELQVRHMRTLIFDVADLAAKFHRIGYNHRDLYCCHFFIHETSAGRYKVNLIDLQRVEFRRRLRRRWIVKDLAQLAYSTPRDYITCSQRVAFVKRYLGVAKLGPAEKRLIRQVLAKQKLMEWQLGKHP